MDTQDLKKKVDAYLRRLGSARQRKTRREDAAKRTLQDEKRVFGTYVKEELRPGLEVIQDSLRNNGQHAEINAGFDPNRAGGQFIELAVAQGGAGIVQSSSIVFRVELSGPDSVTFFRSPRGGDAYSLKQLPRGNALSGLLLDILKRCLPEPK